MTSLLRERRPDGLEILRINRPDKRNAIDTATLHLMNAALTELAADPNRKSVV